MKLNLFGTNVNVWALAALMGMGLFTAACSDDDGNGDGGDDDVAVVEPENGATLSGVIRSGQTVVLKEGYSFKLSGEYVVEDGGLLKIEPGVTIKAQNNDEGATQKNDYIMVAMGGKIDAQGTPDKPIVMTVEEMPAEGSSLGKMGWCGVHICGKAHTNKGNGTLSEIGNFPYGSGTSTANDNDNSGIIRYVRLECAGYAFTSEKEANGLTLYGVGSGTTIDHVQVYRGADDGFEFFGGSVNAKYLIATDCEDDSFDWTEGWNGRGTNLVAVQESEDVLGYACDCLIEADNNENNNEATPVANPELSNLILVGSGSDTEGVRLRRGTYVRMDNAQICGKGKALVVESTYTEQALLDGTDGAHITNTVISNSVDSENGIYTNDAFLADEGNSVNTELNFTPENIQAACSWMTGWTKF